MSSEWWDDFFNNLATDLAPLISLFGESPTKQFLSESVSLIDIFILALAPLGIITIIVSAIRVGGSPSLRAFIGRAQEGSGTIEAELCSSTSRDICEMYSNGGIVRVLGRPKILEIVHDQCASMEDLYGLKGKEKSAGIYTFEEYLASDSGKSEWYEVRASQNILQPRKASHMELECPSSLKDAVSIDFDFPPHPKLSLNVSIKKLSPSWFFITAVLGVLLQSGVLVFAGLSVFAFSKRFEKDDKPADVYAFPFTLAGTLLLCIGVGMCGHVVARSTTERIFKRRSTTRQDGPRSRFFWIQPGNQIIGDQSFDSFAYNETLGDHIPEYITSTRDAQDKDLQRTNSLFVWIFVPVTIFGFILQFIGLRALHSTISIAQLGATILMSLFRSILRAKRLKKGSRLGDDPDLFQGHELDWLAIELDREQSNKKPHVYIWQVTDCPAYFRADLVTGERLYGRVHGDIIMYHSLSIKEHPATPLLLGFQTVLGSDLSDTICENKEIHQLPAELQSKRCTPAPRIFLYRARLARMTGLDPGLGFPRNRSNQWTKDVVMARELAATLGDALRRTTNALFNIHTTPPVFRESWANVNTIFLALGCTVTELSTSKKSMHNHENSDMDVVYVSLSRTSTDLGNLEGQWNIDVSEMEAILGLWMWSLRMRACESSISSRKMIFERLQCVRVLFVSEGEDSGATHSNTEPYLSTLSPWLGRLDNKVRRVRLMYPAASRFDLTRIWAVQTIRNRRATYIATDFDRLRHRLSANVHEWFFGWDFSNSQVLSQQQQHERSTLDLEAVVMRTSYSPVIMCAQDIYKELFRNLLNILHDIGGETRVIKGRHGFYLANDNITEIIRAFTESGLGSENDARACIIPVLLEKKLLPLVNIMAQARDLGDEYRKDGAWEKAEEVLRWAFETSLQSWRLCQPGSGEQVREASTAPEQLESTARANDPEGELWLCVVTLCEFYRWALFSEGKSSGGREFGVRGIIDMLAKGQNLSYLALPHLRDTIEVYGNVALRAAKRSRDLPPLHDAIAQLTKMLRKYKASSKPRTASRCSEANSSTMEIHQSSRKNIQKDEQQETQIQYLERSDTSMISAIKKGHMIVALYYLRGPSAIQEDEEGRSSLSLAAEKGWFIVVKSLVEVGATVRQSDTLKRTPLHLAASSGDKYLVSYLLEQGVDVNSRDIYHRTPLLIAAEHGHKAIVEILLKAGANVNSQDAQHRTPLLLAVEHGHIAAFKIILRAGANFNVNSNLEDGHEETTAHLAEEQSRADILELINQERQRRRGESDG